MNTKIVVGESLTVWCLEKPSQPIRVGTISLASVGSGLVFDYDKQWIETGYALSGDMPLTNKRLISERNLPFGAIADSMPDRWGQKAIAYLEKPQRLTTLDYLYYAGDRRFGMLGYSIDPNQYIPHANSPMPEFASLAEMIDLIDKIQHSEGVELTPQEKLILSTTATMGGAHPKALTTMEGYEWISKFPRGEDVDISLIEYASMQMAKKAEINVSDVRIQKNYLGSVVSLKRFDRVGEQRLHTISAFTAIRHGVSEGMGIGDTDMSYAAMADFIMRAGDPSTQENQRKEIFKRMAFNVMIDNTDDHGNNHAFIRSGQYWNLSPAYDILPTRNNSGRHELILGRDGASNKLENILSSHNRFGLSWDEAVSAWYGVAAVVKEWEAEFKVSGVIESDINNLTQFIDENSKLKLRDPSNRPTKPSKLKS